jgi:uncharacterized membrane protein YgcG
MEMLRTYTTCCYTCVCSAHSLPPRAVADHAHVAGVNRAAKRVKDKSGKGGAKTGGGSSGGGGGGNGSVRQFKSPGQVKEG